jgi:hypothetical protein
MKHSKTIIVVLLALLMMLLSAIPVQAASVYTPVSPTTALTVTQKLHVTGTPAVVPNVTYTYTVAAPLAGLNVGGNDLFCAADVTANAGVYSVGDALGTVTFSPADALVAGYATKTFNVDLSGLTFTQPGVFYLTVTKTATGAGATDASNSHGTHYIFISVIDDAGTLKVETIAMQENANGTGKMSNTVTDQYPASKDSLSIEKTVTGHMGSKDRYFKFTVHIEGLSALAGAKLTVSGSDTVHATYAADGFYYGEKAEINIATDHPFGVDAVTVAADGSVDAVFWLKDGEAVGIEGLLVGATYTITEAAANTDGYTTKYSKNGGAEQNYTATVAGSISATEASNFEFINNRINSVPTGVDLQTAAPVFGLLISAGLFALLMVVKRRKNSVSC